MNWAEINGVGLRYELAGQGGRDVVVIHEMGGLLDCWDGVIPHLRKDNRVLRYDTRGAGLSEKIKGELKIETMADDLAKLLDHVEISGPVVVAGVAVGAAIALCFASRYASRTAGCIAMSPALDVPAEVRQERLGRVSKIEAGGMRAIFEGAMENDYPQNLRDPDPARFATFRARWLGNDPESFCAVMRMLINMDLTAQMAAIKCPTLVIGGQFDKGRPPAYAEAQAKKIPGAKFKVLASGHQMEVQTPDLVTSALLEFLSGLPKG
jgi:3-oxoadipate enol-lactonase